MQRAWRLLVSLRLTAVLLSLLALLLLLNVLLPQEAVDRQTYAAAIRASALARFALVSLGLGHVASSPAFLAALGVFFANLAAVLLDRIGVTLRRLRFVPPLPAALDALMESDPFVLPRPESLTAERTVQLLRGLGYRAVPLGAARVWGVKHRLAILGFPLFHASFFLLCAAGAQVYLTRNALTLIAAEGQVVDTAMGHVERRAPLGPLPPRRLSVERIDVRLDEGKPIDLAAFIALDSGSRGLSRVNHPLVEDELSVLVERAGIAPVLWLIDPRGYTLDRIAVPIVDRGGFPTQVPLGLGLEVALEPIPIGAAFPEREALGSAQVSIRVRRGDRDLYQGKLRRGEDVPLGDGRLRLQEVRYWVGLRLVSERGGGLLVAGFVLAVVGIVWRLVWYRREVAVALDADALRVAGRGEFFPARVREELADLAAVLARCERTSEIGGAR